MSRSPVVGADIMIEMYFSDKYLEEACERYNSEFDILSWWKGNSSRYPILSIVARDILAMPVLTVASEVAFSTGGRVLDVFRGSLTSTMAKTLICAQRLITIGATFTFD